MDREVRSAVAEEIGVHALAFGLVLVEQAGRIVAAAQPLLDAELGVRAIPRAAP